MSQIQQAKLVPWVAVMRDWLPVPEEGKAPCAEGAVHWLLWPGPDYLGVKFFGLQAKIRLLHP